MNYLDLKLVPFGTVPLFFRFFCLSKCHSGQSPFSENFTGLTPLAIKQDFYATMFICNIEALVSYDMNNELQNEQPKKNQKYVQKINKSISFNSIKNHALELLYLDTNFDKTAYSAQTGHQMRCTFGHPQRGYFL